MDIRNLSGDVIEKASKVKLLLMDCDGVLTDGKLYFTEQGESMKVFHVRDGQGLVMWHQAGFESGIISGRRSKIIRVRASELGIKHIKIGSRDKVEDLNDILRTTKVKLEEIAYIGDDIPDICIMQKVGFAVIPADGEDELLPYADYKCANSGGRGAVREIIDLILVGKKS